MPADFVELSCLSSLNIRGGYTTKEGQLKSFSVFGALEHLRLSQGLAGAAWYGLRELDKIRSLELYQQHANVELFKCLGSMSQLTSLQLQAEPIRQEYHHSSASLEGELMPLQRLTKLIQLRLNSTASQKVKAFLSV